MHGTGDKEILARFVGLGRVQNNSQSGTGNIVEIVEIKYQMRTGRGEEILELFFKLWCGVGVETAV